MKAFRVCLFCAAVLMAACQPAVGSKAWCEDMDAKAKGDWTANETGDYLKSCIIRKDK
jgi:Protein of unknown function (DUF3012)